MSAVFLPALTALTGLATHPRGLVDPVVPVVPAGAPEIDIDWSALGPVVMVLGAAVASTLIEAAASRQKDKDQRLAVQPAYLRVIQAAVALVSVAAAALMALQLAVKVHGEDGSAVLTANGAVIVDPLTIYIQLAVAVCALLGLFVIADRTVQGDDAFAPQASAVPGSDYENKARRRGMTQTDVYPLVLFATGGMMLFPAAGDLITMFVALEVLSLPLYLLAGMARHRRLLSQEASLKYFLLGAFGSAFFLFGGAWVYGATGSLKLLEIGAAVSGATPLDPILLVGLVLILVGLFFKVGAVPFHSWTPDVYQGSPTPITGFMAACTKIAAFGVLLRVLYAVVPGLTWDLEPVLWTVSVLTMVVGTVIGLVQKDVKRMLAYSAIAHAGFILTGVTSMSADGLSGSLFYLFTYGVATIGGFGVIALVREVDSDGHLRGEATGLDQWRGLGKRSPVLAGTFAIFLLSFAGIPLTSGFVAKFAVFGAAFASGASPLAVVGLACSAAAAFFYARVIVAMFFEEAPDATGQLAESGGIGIGVRTLGLTQIAIGVSLAFTLVLGIVPGWFLSFTEGLSRLLS
ncbi:MAG: NADH-quinone oxidoreductase subunit NuoN [Bifidobacteriaceae bacterium]|jgi:NADH-quinone oxidoreductase subunit N|nr:NADH-quinone oxidoreductase subunit NuoN [Bifidobacteriaceae bacterium]